MSESDTLEPNFILTPDDVVAVRSLLLQYLPAELANVIIDEAEYWPKLVYTFEPGGEVAVSASSHSRHVATRCCLLSEKLPSDEYGVLMKVIKVRFQIEAHDQGWCSENDFPGAYDGSWTWFEAAIIRDFREGSGMMDDDEPLIQQALELRQHSDNAEAPLGSWEIELQVPQRWLFGLLQTSQPTTVSLVTVENPNTASDVWDIQRNPRANANPTMHEIVWTRDLDNGVDEEAFFRATGSKLGAGFVDALQAGDRIAVLARAQFPGWTNYVKKVELEIYFSV